ncbi:hypothetical protein Tco_0837032 [Tanacetum coccineum]
MASFDYRLNPLYAIKECSSCGTLYTGDCGCSKGSLEDKILVSVPDSPERPLKIEKICLDCGDPVHGLYCRQCALIRKTLEEVFQDFQDTSKSSDDDTNFVNQESFVVKQSPGVNSSQSPPQINHHCCYECGDSLDGIFCQRCTCKSCGKGAHIGYNCPPQIPIISNPEPCYNQNLNEILQNLQSLQQQCLFGTCQQCGCNEYDGVCFYCTVGNGTSINFSTPYSSKDSPSVANHPPQPQYVPFYDIIISGLPQCVAITSALSTEKPVDSLIMEDEHLDTISETESDEFIKYSVENLFPSPSEPEDFSDIENINHCCGGKIPVDVPNIFPTHPTLLMDFDFIPSHNDLGFDLDVSSPSGDRNKIYDPGICIEVESTRFLSTLSPVIDTLLQFSSENKDKVFNHSGLASKEESSFLYNRGLKLPDVSDCDDSRARGYVLHSLELHILSFILGIQYPNLFD